MLGRALAQSRILASSIPVRTLLSARVVSRGSFVSIPSNVVVPSIMPRRFMANNSVKVPPLADSITSAVVLSVNKQVGDSVAIDESVVTLETDKVNIDVRSPVSGVIESILVKESDVVEVAQEIFVVKEGAAGSSAPKTDAAPAKTETPKAADTPAPKTDAPKADTPKAASAPAKTEAPKAAPASTASAPAPAVKGSRTERVEKMSSMRNRIAERLKGSQNTYALLTTFQEADMSNLMALRDEYKDEFAKKHGTKLGFMSAFVKASTVALLDQPIVNSVIADGNIIYRDYVDISIAVATPKGLVTPVLRNCENMSFADIEKQILQYGDKAKKGQITLEDLAGGTFTISNGGVYGSLMGTPIVNPPQSAILGMHAINKKAVVVNDQIVIRPIMVLALTYDHRLIDGRDAVTFLRKIKSVIEDPRRILLDL